MKEKLDALKGQMDKVVGLMNGSVGDILGMGTLGALSTTIVLEEELEGLTEEEAKEAENYRKECIKKNPALKI